MSPRQDANSEGAQSHETFSLWRTAHALCALLMGCLALAAGIAALFAYGCVGSTASVGPCVGGTRNFVVFLVFSVVLVACVVGNILCLTRRPSRWGVILLLIEAGGLFVVNPVGAVFAA